MSDFEGYCLRNFNQRRRSFGQNFWLKLWEFFKKKTGSEPVKCSYRIQIGGGGPNLLESEPLTSKVTITALWKKEQLDLAELARLRWVEKWKYERLAEYFGVGRTTVRDHIRAIKAKPGLAGLHSKPPVFRGG